MNGYAYANDNPVTRSDPTGLESCGPANPSCSQDTIDTINKDGAGSGGSGTGGTTSGGTAGDDEGNPNTVARNNGQTNLGYCFIEHAVSAHDAAVCASGIIASVWAKEHHIDGYITVDVKGTGDEVNSIPKASNGKNKENDGRADVIFWTKDKVYIWEVKPNNEYGREHGPEDLNRYLTKLEDHFDAVGDKRAVEPGFKLPRKRFTSGQGPGSVWSEEAEPGMRYYGTDRRRTRATPRPSPGPSTGPIVKPTRTPTAEPTPTETGTYFRVPRNAASYGLAASVVGVVWAALGALGRSCPEARPVCWAEPAEAPVRCVK
ncbi:hypothetical protein ACWD4F_26970 [Streptomyces aureus]